MLRRLTIVVAFVAMVGAGIASASVLRPAPGAREPRIDDQVGGSEEKRLRNLDVAVPGSEAIGAIADDPGGGPQWAVRTYASRSGHRCFGVGRTDGAAFGPADASGNVLDTPVSRSGTCADTREPLAVALSEYAARAGIAPRSVLFGLSDARVAHVVAVDPDGHASNRPAAPGSFVVVREGLSPPGGWTVTATLSDGSSRSYRR